MALPISNYCHPKQLPFTGPSYTQRARKQATRGSHICKYLYRRNGKEMFTLIQKERIMHLFTTSQTIFPSDMTSRVRQDISHKCILCMCNNSQINKSHCSSNNIFTYSITSGNEAQNRAKARPCFMKALHIPNQILPHVTEYELSTPI